MFSAIKSPANTISIVISNAYTVNIASPVKAKISLVISVIELELAKKNCISANRRKVITKGF
jgi:hypothetical protein